MCDDTGPPTQADDWWFLEKVIAADYPPVRRDPKPYPGQMKLGEADVSPDRLR